VNRAPSLMNPSVKLSWMANRAVTAPSGPVEKLASGIFGPADVVGVAALDLVDEDEDELLDFLSSWLQALPMAPMRKKIPMIPRTTLKQPGLFFCGGGLAYWGGGAE
jgi:hypothetical protein